MLIDLIIAAIFIIIITAVICQVVDGAYAESVFIGIIILIIVIYEFDTIRIVNTSPIFSLAISALLISAVGTLLSMVVHRTAH